MKLMLTQTLKRAPKLFMMAFIAVMLVAGSGCKSKKKAAEAAAAAEEKARIEQEMQAKRQAEEAARRKAEEERLAAERAKADAANSPENKLENYFNAIAGSGTTTSANRSIQEALSMFSGPDAPVLIVISQEGQQKDYDRPTTIKEYLNYLKDTGKSMNKIGDIQYDAAGKITALELVKEY